MVPKGMDQYTIKELNKLIGYVKQEEFQLLLKFFKAESDEAYRKLATFAPTENISDRDKMLMGEYKYTIKNSAFILNFEAICKEAIDNKNKLADQKLTNKEKV